MRANLSGHGGDADDPRSHQSHELALALHDVLGVPLNDRGLPKPSLQVLQVDLVDGSQAHTG